MVLLSAGSADLTPKEKKRQDYILELLESEERYVEDVQIVLEVMSMSTPTN